MILCLQETWLSRDKNKHFKIDSYNKVADNFRTKRVGGGVAIFVSSSSGLALKVKPMARISGMSVEGVFKCCGALITYCKSQVVVVNVYRPPSKENFIEFVDLLDESLRLVQHNYDTPVILKGDFNVDYFQMSWEKHFLCDLSFLRALIL